MDIEQAESKLHEAGISTLDDAIELAFNEKSQLLMGPLVQLLAYKRVEKLLKWHNWLVSARWIEGSLTSNHQRVDIPSYTDALHTLSLGRETNYEQFLQSYSKHLAQTKLQVSQAAMPLDLGRAIESWIHLDLCYQVIMNHSFDSLLNDESQASLNVKVGQPVWSNQLLEEAKELNILTVELDRLKTSIDEGFETTSTALEYARCKRSINLYGSKQNK